MNASIIDEKVREEALLPQHSFIVQAPAGSGKTSLLTQRLLVLLAICQDSPEECLAITFTRKAAFEMRDRVLAALLQAKNPIPPNDPYQLKTWRLARQVLERDEQLGWNLLQNPNRLKIQTIDAFCSSLASKMPILSQFGVLSSIAEDTGALYEAAANNLLKAIEWDEPWSEAVRILLGHLDNNLGLAKRLLAAMLSHRDQWLPYIDSTFSIQESRAFLELGLKAVTEEALFSLVDSIPSGSTEILVLAKFAAEQLKILGKNSLIQTCQLLTESWPASTMDDLPLWLGIGELVLTKENDWRKRITEQQGFPSVASVKEKADKILFKEMKDRMMECLAQLEHSPLFLQNLRQLRECPPEAYNENQWAMVQALVQLLPVLIAELSLVFQERGQVDFVEISLAALRSLGGNEDPTDLALGLDYKISHILVDEFQDTSLSQFRLLEKLTTGWQPNDGRTLFLVGDPMQSVYRFRQAEVGLFIRAKQKGIGAIRLKSLILTANFRSDPKLVEWTNALFTHKFPLKDDIASSAIAFTPSKAMRPAECEAVAIAEAVTMETEPSRVVALVQALQCEEPSASIAILVRSRNHLHALLPHLREASIPYQGIQLELLFQRPIVQDLLSLTRALLHLCDRVAWLAILRTPWAHVSLMDLTRLAQFAPDLPLWHTLQLYPQVPGLSHEAKACLERVVPILFNARLQLQRLPLRTWITDTWLALGGAEHLYGEESIEDAGAFFSVLDENADNDAYEMGAIERRVQRLYAKPTTLAANALQIMTIHKAKGLEFDFVIVPGMGRKIVSASSKLLLWEERAGLFRNSYFMLAPIKPVGADTDAIYTYLKKQEEKRQAYESIRLEYVAATRARKRLFWLTHHKAEAGLPIEIDKGN